MLGVSREVRIVLNLLFPSVYIRILYVSSTGDVILKKDGHVSCLHKPYYLVRCIGARRGLARIGFICT